MSNIESLPPHGLVKDTPFFFLLNSGFIARTGMRPILELYVATDLQFQGPVFQPGPDGEPRQVATSYLVKVLNVSERLLVNSNEMHPINSHLPDGICKHRVNDGSFLAAERILRMVTYPIHPN